MTDVDPSDGFDKGVYARTVLATSMFMRGVEVQFSVVAAGLGSDQRSVVMVDNINVGTARAGHRSSCLEIEATSDGASSSIKTRVATADDDSSDAWSTNIVQESTQILQLRSSMTHTIYEALMACQ